jgi:hypothetical protein
LLLLLLLLRRLLFLAGGLLLGAPYRVAISSTDCNNMLLLISSPGAGSALQLSNLVTFDGGVTFQKVTGLPVVPRTRWYRDQPLAADTVGKVCYGLNL